MTKSISVSALILFIAAIIEATIFSNITWLPAVPDFCMICVLYFSLQNGKFHGELTGFVSGLFIDFLSSGPFGLNMLVRTIMGFFSGMFNKTLNTDGFLIPAIIGFTATIIKGILLYLISILFPSSVLSYNPISWMFLFELIMNTILTPLIFKFLSIFNRVLLVKQENYFNA